MINVQKRTHLSSSSDLFSSPIHSREGGDCTRKKKTKTPKKTEPPSTSTIKLMLKLNKCFVIFLAQESWSLWRPHLWRVQSFSPRTLLQVQVHWAVPAVVAEPSPLQKQLRSQCHCWEMAGETRMALLGLSFSPDMIPSFLWSAAGGIFSQSWNMGHYICPLSTGLLAVVCSA